jgi:YD repeat-containing protein
METYFYDLNGNQTARIISSGLAEEYGQRTITSGLPGECTQRTITSALPDQCANQERRSEFVYDDRDRLVKSIAYDYDHSPYYTSYVYDKAGNVTRTVTGNGQKVATYAYEHRNRLTTSTDPLGQSRTYIYDHNNNLIETIDRNGNKTVNQYNSLNQLTQSTVTMPNGKSQTNNYSYVATGAMGTSANENLTTSYQYDDLGRVVQKSDSNGTALNYSYDLADNLIFNQLTVNGTVQQLANYSYDKQNRLSAIFADGQTTTATAVYAYDANGNRLSKHNQYNDLSSSYHYNRANLLIDLQNRKGAELIAQYQYSYYLDGNQAGKTENHVKTEYIYDGLGQLVTEKEAGAGAKQYTYDQSGNRVKMDVSGAEKYTTVYSYD